MTLVEQNESFHSKLFQKHFKLLSRCLTVESFMSLQEVPQFLHKMNSNLLENWIAGGLFINTPTQLIHFNGKIFA